MADIIYRASDLGSCDRKLIAQRLGYEALDYEDSTIARMSEGALHEEDVLSRLKKEGFTVWDKQKEVRLPVSSRIEVTGHIDAMAAEVFPDSREPHKHYVVEVKSQSQNAWDQFIAQGWDSGFFPKYKWQVSVYMVAQSRPLMLVRKNRNTGEYAISYVDEPFYSREQIVERVIELELQLKSGTVDGSKCEGTWDCPFRYLHDAVEREVLADEVVEVLAREYHTAAFEEKRWKGRKEAARKGLRSGIEADKIVTKGGAKVTFYQAKNPPRLNVDKMKGDGIDVDSYMETSLSERIRVTVPDKD